MIKKKISALFTALGLTLGCLTACGQDIPLLAADDYELNTETNQTSRGITPGDASETFLAAYQEYKFFTSVEGGDYQMLAPEDIPFDSPITILLPTFYIDGLPIDPNDFCKENEIDKAGLIDFLSSGEYLDAHTVEYRYLLFTWENGIITDIRSEYMNYNEDGANWLLYNLA